MDPVTLMIIGMSISAAASAYSAYSTMQYQNQMAEAQARIASSNARTAEIEAKAAKASSREKAQEHKRAVAQLIGKQRAAMGSTGVVVDQGTFMDLTLDTAKQGKLDELAILHEGDMEAWRYRVAGANSEAQANVYRASKQDPGLAAGLSLIGSAGQGLGYYATFKG